MLVEKACLPLTEALCMQLLILVAHVCISSSSASLSSVQRLTEQENVNGCYERKGQGGSGGLRSPKPEVPPKAILQRIDSKSKAQSYQLGHQLSLKWCSGVGPRIGCVADYPRELRFQALEFVNLSPRVSSPSASRSFPTSPLSTQPIPDFQFPVCDSSAA
ncbi:IQ domain-containing protein [Nymphaea thermarum]|nr:IQ domain-containing protein [Nymphaea thermarum]